MPRQDYRYYCLDGSGHLHETEWFQAANDEDAIAQISAKHPDSKCEIWRGSRMVGSLPSELLRAYPVACGVVS